jgi:hypothetical protein
MIVLQKKKLLAPCGDKAKSLFDGVDQDGFIHHVKLPTRNCLLEAISKFCEFPEKSTAKYLRVLSLSVF